MKKLLLCLFGFPLFVIAQSHNVGIGIAIPQSTLDVRGNHRMGGLSSFLTFDTTTARIEWHNANLYVPVSQYLLKHSAAGDGLYYNNTPPVSGQLEYRNAAGSPVFFTNFTNGNGYFSGNLGLGVMPTGYRLYVGSGTVRLEGATNNGIPAAALSLSSLGEVQVDAPFIPGGRFLIKENGRVGIGVTSPAYLLDVGQRIRIRSGGNNAVSAGLWFNNNANTEAAFIGMEDDTHTGFYGLVAGWKFSVNTQTGALKINGSEGSAGQILQSNGSAAAPAWSNKPSVLFFNQPNTIILEGNNTSVDIPNINGQSFNLPQASAVTLQFSIPLTGVNGITGGNSDGIVGIQLLDGSNNVVVNASSLFNVPNYHSVQVFVVGGGNLNPGTYTVRARVARQNTGTGNTYSDAGVIAGIPI